MKTELCTRKTLQRRVPKINTAAKLSISKKNKKDWARGCSRKMFTPSSKVLKPLEKKKKKKKKDLEMTDVSRVAHTYGRRWK